MQNIWWSSEVCSPGGGPFNPGRIESMCWSFPFFLVQIKFQHSHGLLTSKVPMEPIYLVQSGIQSASISYKTLYRPNPHYLF